MNELFELKKNIKNIEEKIGIEFKDKDILVLSFVHRSYVNENKKIINHHNERLEYLGDATLNLVVSDYLYNKLPSFSEGKLSHIRSQLVNAKTCKDYFEILKLNDFVLLGKGEKAEKRGKLTIYADAFEALIGAVFIDKGFEVTKKFILDKFINYFENVTTSPEIDYKGKLQEYAQKKYLVTPLYKVFKEEGPEHQKTFHVVIIVDNKEIGFGIGPSKKIAEQIAAENAYNQLNLEEKK